MDLASLVWPFVIFERKGNEMHVKLPNYLFQTGAGKTTCMCKKLRGLYRKIPSKWQKILGFMPS